MHLLVLLNSLHFLNMLLRVSKPSSSWTWSDGSIIWITESCRGILSIYNILIEILLYFIILIIWDELRNILWLYFKLIFLILNIIFKIILFISSIIMIPCIFILFDIRRLIFRVAFPFEISSMILWTAIFIIHLRIIRFR